MFFPPICRSGSEAGALNVSGCSSSAAGNFCSELWSFQASPARCHVQGDIPIILSWIIFTDCVQVSKWCTSIANLTPLLQLYIKEEEEEKWIIWPIPTPDLSTINLLRVPSMQTNWWTLACSQTPFFGTWIDRCHECPTLLMFYTTTTTTPWSSFGGFRSQHLSAMFKDLQGSHGSALHFQGLCLCPAVQVRYRTAPIICSEDILYLAYCDGITNSTLNTLTSSNFVSLCSGRCMCNHT